MRPFACLLAAALLAGCASIHLGTRFGGVTVEDGREGVATVEIENSGWFLFNFLPLGSGDPDNPGGSGLLFTDTVTLASNMKILAQAMTDTGAKDFCNLTSHISEEHVFFVLLMRRCYHTSAVLLKEKKP